MNPLPPIGVYCRIENPNFLRLWDPCSKIWDQDLSVSIKSEITTVPPKTRSPRLQALENLKPMVPPKKTEISANRNKLDPCFSCSLKSVISRLTLGTIFIYETLWSKFSKLEISRKSSSSQLEILRLLSLNTKNSRPP